MCHIRTAILPWIRKHLKASYSIIWALQRYPFGPSHFFFRFLSYSHKLGAFIQVSNFLAGCCTGDQLPATMHCDRWLISYTATYCWDQNIGTRIMLITSYLYTRSYDLFQRWAVLATASLRKNGAKVKSSQELGPRYLEFIVCPRSYRLNGPGHHSIRIALWQKRIEDSSKLKAC